MTKRRLENLNFDNSFARLSGFFYSHVEPTCFKSSYLVSYAPDVFELLDLDPQEALDQNFVQYFSGQKYLPGSYPVAMAYAGHQFGHYVNQLGDGRALLVGEVVNHKGERWDLHIKGSGTTPYSRGFDGRAVLRSCIREYLASEAMYNLGIPTTRALCIIGTGELVSREEEEKGALLVRVSPTHIRFGSFEFFYYKGKYNEVKLLADYCIQNYYPHLLNRTDKYELFFEEIIYKTANLIADWMAIGFTHGVLNTDNMSILGITIDYGPYGFIDNFSKNHVPNHSDYSGRYSYINQPYIGLWNLLALRQALEPILPNHEASIIHKQYSEFYRKAYFLRMRSKLGLKEKKSVDEALIGDLIDILDAYRVDYTIFFRQLSDFRDNSAMLNVMFNFAENWQVWLNKYIKRLQEEGVNPQDRKKQMNSVNPKFILRNYMAEIAIKKANLGDYTEINNLLQLLKRSYEEQDLFNDYAKPPPEWASKICISCSS